MIKTKPQFLTPLVASRQPSKNNPSALCWRLEQPLIFWSSIIGRIHVPQHFETDFASVPRLPLAFLVFGDTAHAPAVVHDYLCAYQYPRRLVTWSTSTAVFDEALSVAGVSWWRRKCMILAVQLYGVSRATTLRKV